tara:strand:- start:12382 stop:12579 length:198 start_codon:yes stop_codon:yes gene_type:complete
MAVQKSKKSKSKKLQKRAHHSLTDPTLSTDPVSGERHMRHNMTADGFYKGKKIIELKNKEEEPED